MKAVADTSWLIAHINAEDRFHRQARKESESAQLVHIPAAIWVEFLNLLQYRFGGHSSATRASQQIRDARNVQLGDRLDDEAVQRVWRKHSKLTYADAAAVAEARRLGLELLTFEEDERAALAAERNA